MHYKNLTVQTLLKSHNQEVDSHAVALRELAAKTIEKLSSGLWLLAD